MKLDIMSIFIILILVGIFFVSGQYFHYSPLYKKISRATATIHPTEGNHTHGIVTFEEKSDGLHIHATITGLTPGNHGFHIHEYGDCNCADATCAGDHFNPTHTHHGSETSCSSHIGDLGNLTADTQGVASYKSINTHARLNGPHSIIGRAVIVHEKEDDLQSQPTGNAGARVGCGVIGIAR